MAAAQEPSSTRLEPPTGDDLRRDLRAVLEHLRGIFGTTAGRAARMVVADSLSHPDLADAFHGLVAQRRAPTRRIIEQAVARGELRRGVDAEVVTDMLAGRCSTGCSSAATRSTTRTSTRSSTPLRACARPVRYRPL